jgi:hypothetical protein
MEVNSVSIIPHIIAPTMEVLMDDEIESATVQSMYTDITEDDAGDHPPPPTDSPPKVDVDVYDSWTTPRMYPSPRCNTIYMSIALSTSLSDVH